LGNRLAAGRDFTCAIATGGRVRCWGANERGQLGDGTTVARNRPADVVGLANAVSIGAEGDHACAILQPPDAAPNLWCWGANREGVLGDGTLTDRATPVLSLGGMAVTQVSVGFAHSCAIDGVGVVQCWGLNGAGGLAAPSSLVRSLTPVPIVGPPPGVTPIVATSVAAGAQSCATYSDGSGWCWGFNNLGGLGDNSTRGTFAPWYPSSRAPVPVWGLRDGAGIDAAGERGCARFLASSPAGEVLLKCWGEMSIGDVGAGEYRYTSKPFTLRDTKGVTKVAVGGGFACGVLVGGGLQCWGGGPLGLTPSVALKAGLNFDWPRPVETSGPVVDVAAGNYHACALLASGAVECWGANEHGQIGQTSPTRQPTPLPVVGT